MSKTVLFTPTYLDHCDDRGNIRLARNVKWVRYYESIREQLGFDTIWMCDNSSSVENRMLFRRACPQVRMHTFDKHLPKGEGLDMPYLWRALNHIRELISIGADKILIIDSDFFVLSGRLAAFLKGVYTGWHAMWCPKYGFPEAACQVLTQDAFPLFLGYTSIPWERLNGQLMECSLPFSCVHQEFNCDRWGEDRVPVPENADGYAQAPLDIAMIFRP